MRWRDISAIWPISWCGASLSVYRSAADQGYVLADSMTELCSCLRRY